MRLTHPSIRPVGRSIGFQFNGSRIEALEGETLAAALSAAGIVAYRRMPSGAPRGLHCGMGACWDCVVTVDGRIGQRACMTRAADGLVVESGFPDALARPRSIVPAQERECDVLVVGGGVAGLSAAIAAAEAGAAVVLLDERASLGGQYAKPLAGSHADAAPDAQFRLGASLGARAQQAGVRIERDALVWGAFAADEIAVLIAGQAVTIRPRRLILATGAHEAPVPVPGWTLPGVMTTGGLQTLVRTQRVLPGRLVLIAGNGPLNLQLACELVAARVKPVAVLEAAPRPGVLDGLKMARSAANLAWQGAAMLARLRRAAVPVLWNTRLDRLDGDGRVQSATAGGRRFAVDVVALNMGFQPETGLARALGARHCVVARGAASHLATVTDPEGRTSVAGVFAAGDGAALGGSRLAQARGRLAGLAAARDLGFAAPPDPATLATLRKAEAFQDALWSAFRAAGSRSALQAAEAKSAVAAAGSGSAFEAAGSGSAVQGAGSGSAVQAAGSGSAVQGGGPSPTFQALGASVPDETIVCRCEEVTAGRVQAEIAAGLGSIAALKKATRAGMGRCQGRFCAATIAAMCPSAPDADGYAAPRAPLRPVPVAPLMQEAAEFVAPLLPDPAPPVVLHPLPPLPAETRHADVVVIGGGAAGLSTAYFLARDGADVLLIDRDEVAMAASTANAGSLHVQLLSYDFTDETPPDGGPAAHTLPLAPRSIALWKAIGAEAGEDLGIRTEGGLMLAEEQAGFDWLRRKSALEKRSGIESHVLGSNELRDLAPALSDRMLGADFVPAEGYGDPLRGMMALLKLVRAHGARLLRGAEVQTIARDGVGWRITTSRGDVTAGRVVNATGPWAARIGRMVGLDLPVTGTVQQVIVTEPVPAMTRHLVAVAKRHLSLKQQANGSFLIGGGWYGGFDAATGRTRALRRSIEGNLWICERALPVAASLSIVRSWTGINPAIDRAPLLGEAPGLSGFFNVVTANGYTLGPVVGQLTANAVLHGEAIDPRYRLERFS